MVPCGINYWLRWFFNGFSNFENQWFTMVTKKAFNNAFFSQRNEICDKMCVNKDLKKTETQLKGL